MNNNLQNQELLYFSESGIEILYGTDGAAGLDLPIWDARLTEEYKTAKANGATEQELDELEKELVSNPEVMNNMTLTLDPMEQYTVKTGVYMKIPEGHYGQLDTRSSTSKIRLDLLCHTIDSDYIGNIRLAIINLNTEPVTLKAGQSIAQILIKKYERVDLVPVSSPADLGSTERGDKGFGHTGRNV